MPLPDFTSQTTFPPFTSLPFTTAPTPAPSPGEHEADEEEEVAVSVSEEKEKEKEAGGATYYLLGEIANNMTLTKPTLVCTDAAGTRFAVVFDSRTGAPPGVGTADDADPDDALDLARLGYKKGATLVLPGARRTRPRDSSGGSSGAGFVSLSRADEAGVRVVPAGLRVLTRVGASLRARDGDGNEGGGGDGAEVGGGGGGGGRRPRGCESCGRTTRKGAEAEEGKAGLMRCTGCGEMEYCSKECQIKGWNEDGHKGECKVIKAIRAVWP